MTSSCTLQANNLTKQFIQNGTALNILENINVSFEQSKSYAISGASGSGKSTFLHLLSGVDTPTCGTVYFNQKDINQFNQKEKEEFLNKNIGLVFQEPYLIKELTILENIMIKSWHSGNNSNKAMRLLQKLGLQDKANCLPAMLSVGQQQRVAILRAIFNKPKFLLADEPTANLDQKSALDIINLLKQIKDELNIGIVVATHDKYFVESCENKLSLNNGNLTTI